jgi:hypothetical protein
MSEELVRLRGLRNQEEVNARCVSYKVNRWGCVSVPAEDVAPLLKTGGFHVASEDDASADHSSLSDVAEVCWHLPLGKVRDTLLALLTNTNARNLLVERARPNISII